MIFPYPRGIGSLTIPPDIKASPNNIPVIKAPHNNTPAENSELRRPQKDQSLSGKNGNPPKCAGDPARDKPGTLSESAKVVEALHSHGRMLTFLSASNATGTSVYSREVRRQRPAISSRSPGPGTSRLHPTLAHMTCCSPSLLGQRPTRSPSTLPSLFAHSEWPAVHTESGT